MKNFFRLLVAVVIVLLAFAVFMLATGRYDVSADQESSALEEKVLPEIRDASIERHAQGILVPDLAAPGLADSGFHHYHQMCFTCHGAPGISLPEIGAGLNPTPPSLYFKSVQEGSDAELFWVVKHGIKMTGMPAFGVTHTDEELWAIVAFMRKLPGMTSDQYEDLVKKAGMKMEQEDDDHAESEAPPAAGDAGEGTGVQPKTPGDDSAAPPPQDPGHAPAGGGTGAG